MHSGWEHKLTDVQTPQKLSLNAGSHTWLRLLNYSATCWQWGYTCWQWHVLAVRVHVLGVTRAGSDTCCQWHVLAVTRAGSEIRIHILHPRLWPYTPSVLTWHFTSQSKKKTTQAGSENHSPHCSRKRSHFGTGHCKPPPPHTTEKTRKEQWRYGGVQAWPSQSTRLGDFSGASWSPYNKYINIDWVQ